MRLIDADRFKQDIMRAAGKIGDCEIVANIWLKVIDEQPTAYDADEVVERLSRYEALGLTPEQLRKIDDMYADRCKEISELKKQIEQIKQIKQEKEKA